MIRRAYPYDVVAAGGVMHGAVSAVSRCSQDDCTGVVSVVHGVLQGLGEEWTAQAQVDDLRPVIRRVIDGGGDVGVVPRAGAVHGLEGHDPGPEGDSDAAFPVPFLSSHDSPDVGAVSVVVSRVGVGVGAEVEIIVFVVQGQPAGSVPAVFLPVPVAVVLVRDVGIQGVALPPVVVEIVIVTGAVGGSLEDQVIGISRCQLYG